MTRREQYLKQRARFQRRRERARSINSIWGRDPITGRTKRLGYRPTWFAVGIMAGHRTKGTTWAWTDHLPPGLPHPETTFTGGGRGKPPHCHLPPHLSRPNEFAPSSADYVAVGMHLRRVQRWDRKAIRMTVLERRIYCANLLAWYEGYFQDDDPLQRRPTGLDIQNGWPYISEFPYAL